MAIGAIGACLFYSKRYSLKIIYHPISQVIGWGWLLISIFYHPIHIPILTFLDKDYHALFYLIIILNVATKHDTLVSLEYKILNFLGSISYGIYAYHFIVLFLISIPLRHIIPFIPSSILQRGVMFLSEIAATVIFAHFSFKYYEKWFLKKKTKFMQIESTNEKPEQVVKLSLD